MGGDASLPTVAEHTARCQLSLPLMIPRLQEIISPFRSPDVAGTLSRSQTLTLVIFSGKNALRGKVLFFIPELASEIAVGGSMK